VSILAVSAFRDVAKNGLEIRTSRYKTKRLDFIPRQETRTWSLTRFTTRAKAWLRFELVVTFGVPTASSPQIIARAIGHHWLDLGDVQTM
jgi:hypothetical protein